MSVTTESTVGEWVLHRPSLARVFEKLGLDYCCGGKRPLGEACQAKGLDPTTVMAVLNAEDGTADGAPVDVSTMTVSELADHIQGTHHAYLKSELPRLHRLVDRIAARHSDKNPQLGELAQVYSAFRSDLEAHMAKEERILFPLIRQIDQTRESNFAGGTVADPIRVMEIEHQHAGDALALMRQMTDDFSTPPGACNTYRATMQALHELESDMHQHVHKENNVLFPRAIAAASGRARP